MALILTPVKNRNNRNSRRRPHFIPRARAGSHLSSNALILLPFPLISFFSGTCAGARGRPPVRFLRFCGYSRYPLGIIGPDNRKAVAVHCGFSGPGKCNLKEENRP